MRRSIGWGILSGLWAVSLVASAFAAAEVEQKAGPYHLKVSTDPSPPAAGQNTVTVQVQDAQGKAVSGATVKVTPNMLDMAMASESVGATSVPDQPGQYTAVVSLGMAGRWELKVDVDGPAGAAAASFRLKTGQGFIENRKSKIENRKWMGLALALVLVVLGGLVLRRTGRPHWLNRQVVGGLVLLAVALLGTEYVVKKYKKPGQMTLIEAQAMDMTVMKAPLGVVPVAVEEVRREVFAPTVTYTGSVVAYTDQDVYPRVPGWIVDLPVYPGDVVHPGQLVARLDSEEYGSREKEALLAHLSAQEQAGAARAELRQAVGMKSQAAAELDQARSLKTQAETMLAAARAAKAQAEAEVAAARGAVEQAQSDLLAAQAMKRETESDLAAAQNMKEEAVNQLAAAQAALREMQGELAAAQAMKKEAEQQWEAARAALQQAQKELEVSHSERKGADRQVASAQAMRKESDSQLAGAQALLRQAQNELAAARSGLAEAESNVTAAEAEQASAQAEAETMQAMLPDAQAEVASARADLDYWEAEIQREAQLLREGAVSKEEYQREEAQYKAAQAKVQQAQAKVQQVQANLRNAQAKQRRAAANLKAAQARREQSQAMVEAAAAKIEQARADIAMRQAQIERSAAEVGMREAGAEGAATTIGLQEARVQAAEADVKMKQAAVERAEADVQRKQAAVERGQAEVKMRASAVARAEADIQAKQARLEQADAMIATRQAAVAQARAAWQASEARVAQAQAAIDQAQAGVAEAQANVRKALAGVRTNDAAVQAAASKQAAMAAMANQARQAAFTANTIKHYTELRARVHGVVTQRITSPTTLVQPGMLIVKIAQIDRVRLQANVAEADVKNIVRGAPVRVRTVKEPHRVIETAVTSIFPSTDPNSRTSIVEALTPNPDNRLLPGDYIVMEITIGRPRRVLTVPSSAIVQVTDKVGAVNGQTRPAVWTVLQGGKSTKPEYYCTMHPEVVSDQPGDCPKCHMKLVPRERAMVGAGLSASPKTEYYCPMHPEVVSDKPGLCPKCNMKLVPRELGGAGKAHRVFVEVGATDGKRTEILAGLREGDQVIYAGHEYLKEGDPVSPSAWTEVNVPTLGRGGGHEGMPGMEGGEAQPAEQRPSM